MQSTTELIAELDAVAKEFKNTVAAIVVIVVDFEDNTAFIHAQDKNRFANLDLMIKAGGKPLGIVAVADEVVFRVSDEYKSDKQIAAARMYMRDAIDNMMTILLEGYAGPDKPDKFDEVN